MARERVGWSRGMVFEGLWNGAYRYISAGDTTFGVGGCRALTEGSMFVGVFAFLM